MDDVRLPNNVTWVDLPPNQHYSVVRNYNEFVDLVTLRGLPKFVTYDHDLADSHYGDGLHGDDINYNPSQLICKVQTFFIYLYIQCKIDSYTKTARKKII